MLIDLTVKEEELDRILKHISDNKEVYTEEPKYYLQNDPMWKQGTGIYQCCFDFNFHTELFKEFDNYKDFSRENYFMNKHGVADSIEQILEYHKDLIEDKVNTYVLSLTPVRQDKSCEGQGGGWRWHKWGKYIGKLNPQYEYLDDEEFGDDFKYVICYNIYCIRTRQVELYISNMDNKTGEITITSSEFPNAIVKTRQRWGEFPDFYRKCLIKKHGLTESVGFKFRWDDKNNEIKEFMLA